MMTTFALFVEVQAKGCGMVLLATNARELAGIQSNTGILTMTNFKTIEIPKYVGGYQIGGPNALQINFTKKPLWLHRFMCKLVLGFVWVDL